MGAPPNEEDFPLIQQLNAVAERIKRESLEKWEMAHLLEEAANEIFRAYYDAWENAMGEDL